MATPAQARELDARLNTLIRRAGRAEDQAARQVLAEVDAFRRDLLGLMTSGRSFSQTARRIDDRAASLRIVLEALVDRSIGDAAELGLELVDRPLTDVGVDTGPVTRLSGDRIAQDHRTLARGIVRDHVTNLADRSKAVILRARAVTGGLADALKAVGEQLQGSTVVARPANYLASVARTSTATAVSDASYRRMVELERRVPDLRKRWDTSRARTGSRDNHRRLAEATAEGIPIDRPYQLAGVSVQWPRDPALPPREVVNCRCQSVITLATT